MSLGPAGYSVQLETFPSQLGIKPRPLSWEATAPSNTHMELQQSKQEHI